ncbi:MAG: hypothetical protein R2880_02370 [Deinococcales bacterium]
MGAIGIEYIRLAIPKGDSLRAKDFYGRLLALEELAKPKVFEDRLWYRLGIQRLELIELSPFNPSKELGPAILMRDLAILVKRLSDARYEFQRDESWPVFDHIYLYDPFGNRLDFLEPR